MNPELYARHSALGDVRLAAAMLAVIEGRHLTEAVARAV